MKRWALGVPLLLGQNPLPVGVVDPASQPDTPSRAAAPSGQVRSTPSRSEPAVQAAVATRGYGVQTAVVDVASLGIILLGSAASQPQSEHGFGIGPFVVGYGISAHILGGPIVHLSHRQPLRALGSLVLRGAIPIGLTYAGVPVPGHCPYIDGDPSTKGTWCDIGYVLPWELAVFGPAAVIDALFLAREPLPAGAPSDTGRTATLSILPVVHVRTSTMGIGVVGTF